MPQPSVLFIGAGRMATAVIAGLSKTHDFHIIATNLRDQSKLDTLRHTYEIQTIPHWSKQIQDVEIIILACPPEVHDSLLAEIKPHITKQLVITIAVGYDVTRMQASLPPKTAVAWIMPNTAAEIGQSISLYTCGEYVSTEQKKLLLQIMDAIGQSQECTELQVHELTAITGSAPAFFYQMVYALEQSAIQYGIQPSDARKLVTQMVLGSSLMLQSGASPLELSDQVTTPGGATAAGLQVLEKYQFYQMMQEAVLTTNHRAKELGEKSN